MAYGIGAILAVIVGIIVGLIFRKRFLNAISRNIHNPPTTNTESSYVFIEKVLNEAKNEMKREVINWMKLLGSTGQI